MNNCSRLKDKFGGLYPADKFPVLLPNDSFAVVKSEKSNSTGKHWIVWSNVKSTHNFTDRLGLHLFSHHTSIAERISSVKVDQISEDASPLQSQSSDICGFYCISIAHFLFSSQPDISYKTKTDLLRFVKHL